MTPRKRKAINGDDIEALIVGVKKVIRERKMPDYSTPRLFIASLKHEYLLITGEEYRGRE